MKQSFEIIESEDVMVTVEHHIDKECILPESEWVDSQVPIEQYKRKEEFCIEPVNDGAGVCIGAGGTKIELSRYDFLKELSRFMSRSIREGERNAADSQPGPGRDQKQN